MWSDPEDVETWAISPRGAGWLFGAKVTNEVRVIFISLFLHVPVGNVLHLSIRYLFFENIKEQPACTVSELKQFRK